MNTEKLVIFGLGVIAGYLLLNYMNQNKPAVATNELPPTDALPPTPLVSPIAQIDVEAICEDRWIQQNAAIKWASEEAYNAARDEFLGICGAEFSDNTMR